MTKHLHLSTKVAALVMAGALMFAPTSTAFAASLTDAQINAIIALLVSFNADQSAINNVSASLRGQTVVAPPPWNPGYNDGAHTHLYPSYQYPQYPYSSYTYPYPSVPSTPSTVGYAPSMTFTASHSYITVGQSTTLTWNSLNSNRCGIQDSRGGDTVLMTSGSVTKSPTVTTTYKLWCVYDRNTGTDVPSTQSLTVYVN